MAFVASIDRQLELQLAGSCKKIGHHSAWPWCQSSLNGLSFMDEKEQNERKTHVLCLFCSGCSYHEDRKKTLWSLPCQFTLCVLVRWESTLLFSCWSSTESSPGMYTAAPLGMFLKLPPFFSSPFKCLRLSEIIIFLQWGYRHIGMGSIAQTCPLHNCSHLGKVVVKPSTVLESQGLLHNSTPKFGLSFTG